MAHLSMAPSLCSPARSSGLASSGPGEDSHSKAPPGPQVTSMYPGSQSCHLKLRDSPPFPQTSSSGAKGLAFPGWVRGSKGPSMPKRPKAMLPHRASPRETCPRSCHVGHNLCQSRDSGSIDQSLFALHRKGPPCMQVPWPSTMMGL